MILSIKETLLSIILLTAMVLATIHLVKHARYADSIFGDLTEETMHN